MEEPNYYAIIPANVRYDNDLTSLSKLIYAEITALSNKNGYCFASNNYFAELYNCTKITIQRQLGLLIKKGYIRAEIQYYQGTFRVKERRLYLVSKMISGSIKNDMRPSIKNDTYNNIKINNKNNKSNFKNRKYTENELNKFYE